MSLTIDIAEIEMLWPSCIDIYGVRFTGEPSIFPVIAGWIAEMLFMLLFAYIAVQWTEHMWCN